MPRHAFRLGCGDRTRDLDLSAAFSPVGAYTSIAPPATPLPSGQSLADARAGCRILFRMVRGLTKPKAERDCIRPVRSSASGRRKNDV